MAPAMRARALVLGAAVFACIVAWYVVSARTTVERGAERPALTAPTAAPTSAPALPPRVPAAAPSVPPPLQRSPLADCIIASDSAVLTVPERIDRGMASPSMFGVLRGVVGAPQAKDLPDLRNAPGGPVADYPFTLRGFTGRTGVTPYEAGTQLTLRVPTDKQECGGRPTLAPGDEVFAVVRDQGGMAGGNTPSVLVVTAATDVYTVRAGLVHGQGPFASFSEPIQQFELHFQQRRE